MMGDIYRDATSLVIWLGPAEKHTEEAFSALERLVDSAYWRLWRDGKDIAVRDILHRAWWSRIWVIQEIAKFNARSSGVLQAYIVCGAWKMLWSRLVKTADNMAEARLEDPKYGMPVAEARRVLALETLRIKIGSNPRDPSLDLFNLVKKHRAWRSSDPRDKIYAVLGLSRESDRQIRPNYEKIVNVLLWELTTHTISASEKLNILCHCQERDPRASRSWVPDWSTPLSHPIILDSEDDRSFHTAYGEVEEEVHFIATKNSKAQVVFSPDMKTLSAEGILFDVVQQTTPSFPRYEEHDTPDEVPILTTLFYLAEAQHDFLQYASETHPYGDSDGARFALWSSVFTSRAYFCHHDTIAKDRTEYSSWFPPISSDWEPRPSVELSTIKFAPARDWGTQSFDLAKGPFWIGPALDPFDSYREEDLFWSYRNLKPKHLYNRRLFITKKGYVGLGPSRKRAGDQVVLLSGGDVPFILSSINAMPNDHELIGECYVHSIMHGEAYESSLKDQAVQVFDIT